MDILEKLRSLADRYAIEREIGSGGMATVYLARDLKHDREVALKVLRADLSAVIGTERFLAEVRIAAKLDHPHILTLIDSGSADGRLYYVLPYVRGESLRAKLDREKQLAVQEAVAIITQVASALDYAHEQGVVHRDVKPENVLLHEGEAMLTDFGIAIAVKAAGGNRLTETGISLGTPLYMSPEQATGDRSLDRRSDVYSLAAVFYEMMAGEPPITGPSAQAIIAKLLTEKPVKLRVVREAVPLSIERATEKALAKTPADRFGSAGEFARALSAAVPVPERPVISARTLIAAWALVGIGLIGTGLWLTSRKSIEPARRAATLSDRTQITYTGRVSLLDIADDGKTIAYVSSDCGGATSTRYLSVRASVALGPPAPPPTPCRYAIGMQDVARGSSRLLLENATAVYAVEVSPDRRNVLLIGSIKGVVGSFLISTLGGAPAYLGSGDAAAFWAGGDSLLLVRASGPAHASWILVSGLDGVPTDSIRVEGPADVVARLTVVPNSQRILYAVVTERNVEWISTDRRGKRYSSMRFPQSFIMGGTATVDALWVSTQSARSIRASLVRIPFDASTGRLAQRGDTVYTGMPRPFTVTADGGTLLLNEGTTEYSGWALSLADLLKGRFTEDKRLTQATTNFEFGLSNEGSTILVENAWVHSAVRDGEWAVMPFEGGQPTPIQGRHQSAWFVDSTTLGIVDEWSVGAKLSLFDFRTGRRSAVLLVPDPIGKSVMRLGRTGWAWTSLDGKSIRVQRDSEPGRREIQFPGWYRRVIQVDASDDGNTIAFVGWNQPADSLGIGLLSLADDRFMQLWTTFGEDAKVSWLRDGSLLIALYDTPESVTLYRARVGGQIGRLGSVRRPIANLQVSSDLRRAVAVTRHYVGDAFRSTVVR